MKEYKRETISKIISLVNRNVLLPDIQRPFVWDEQQIYKLFDSLMRGYPISTFLFWDLTREQLEAIEEQENLRIKMYKFVDSNEKENEEELNRERDTYSLVLDGQQRLTSLFIALKGTWRKKIRRSTVTQELYFDTLKGHNEDEEGILYQFQFLDKTNGFVKIETEDNDNSFAIWVNVKQIYEKDIGSAQKRKAFVEDIIKSDNRLTEFRDRIDDNIDRFNDVLKEDGVINYFPEDETDYEKVLDIFVRTNAGGTKLGYSDLLFSKIKLRWTDARERFKELLDSLNKRNFDFDTDFLLKACLTLFSTKAEEVRYSVSNLGDTLIDKIVSHWDLITRATQLTVGLLETFLITDKKQLPSYNALIPIIYWHFKTPKREYRQDSHIDSKDIGTIRVWLTKALLSGAFSGQSDTTLYKCKEAIDNSGSVTFPALDIQHNIKTMKSRSMEITEESFDDITYKSKESYLFLSLCYKMAINFRPVTKGNLPEQDHIFSRDELQKAGVPSEKINSIYNIRYVTATDNRTKSSIPFSEWMAGLRENKNDVFKTHLIPYNHWSVDSFDEFLSARKKELLYQIEYQS